jgi:CMP-N,N'-diacetyllegionaminic acid synthase
VFQHALRWLKEHEAYEPAAVAHLRPTHPLRDPAVIDAAIERFLSLPDADSLRSVNIAAQSPYKMWRIGPDGCLAPVVRLDDGRDGHSSPRQALPRVFWQNGYVDVTRPSVILEQNSMGGRRIVPFITDGPSVEIDYAEDLREAERLLGGGAPAKVLTPERHPS